MPLMSSPFLTDVVKVVGSLDAPQDVVSEESGSTLNVLEIRLRSPAPAGVSDGAPGGAPPPALGLPQLNNPPLPLTLTAPAAHAGTGEPAPELAQSKVTPAGGVRRMSPSSASQLDGAAFEGRGNNSAAVALTARASNAARRRKGRTVAGTVPEFKYQFNRAQAPSLPNSIALTDCISGSLGPNQQPVL